MKITLNQLRELIREQTELFINESRSKDIKDYYEEVIDEVLSEISIEDKWRDKVSDFVYKTDRDVEEEFSLGHSANNCAKNILKKYRMKLYKFITK
jgi:hypothetical protein